MKYYLKNLFFFAWVLFSSCEKADDYTMDARANFEALWTIMNEHYCFFGYKDVNWDKVYRKYSPQVTDTMDRYQLFDLLGNMLAELKDGHTNLVSPFNVARYWSWYEDYPANFNREIQKNYLGTRYSIAGGMKYLQLPETKIGYIYYGSFSNSVGEKNLDEVLFAFRKCKGLIIDVRDNGGGSLTNSDRIASRFLKKKIVAGYILHKTGPAHDAFSEPYPIELEPSNRLRWMRPVVVLTNRHSYSATNDFVNKMKLLDQVTIMGDRTGGGSGLPFNSELPNGWTVRFSASPMLNADKQHTENGIDPDIKVDMKKEDMEKGKDTIIEEAIRYIGSKTEKN